MTGLSDEGDQHTLFPLNGSGDAPHRHRVPPPQEEARRGMSRSRRCGLFRGVGREDRHRKEAQVHHRDGEQVREVRLNHDIRAPVLGASHPIQDEDGVEYDFSQLQSDLLVSLCGKSDQDSTEVGLLVNFLSLRLCITLIERMKKSSSPGRCGCPT